MVFSFVNFIFHFTEVWFGKGNGVCYSYDAVGSFESAKYTTSGTGTQLLQPVFDNQVSHIF